jgi:hypothetical protein
MASRIAARLARLEARVGVRDQGCCIGIQGEPVGAGDTLLPELCPHGRPWAQLIRIRRASDEPEPPWLTTGPEDTR